MKMMSVFFAVLVCMSCGSQNIPASKVPSVVVNALKEKHSVNNNVEWEKNRNLYEAEVQLNDSTEATLQIDESGKLLMEKQDIEMSELPVAIQTLVQSDFVGFAIDEVEKLEKNGNTYYQVELENGKKERKLILTADGKQETQMTFWD